MTTTVSETMKEPARANAKETVSDTASVLAFLRENPFFFHENPSILGAIKVPHPCGEGVISLIERQVWVLRDQLRQYRRQFSTITENAKRNEHLIRQLHELTLQLIECDTLDAVFTVLYDRLTADFMADALEIRILEAPREEADRQCKEYTQWGGETPADVQPLIASGKPVSIQVRAAQLDCLFGEQATNFGSGMIIPLKDRRVGDSAESFGLLAIASRDPERFRHTLGTEFMNQLGEIISQVMARFFHAPKA